MNPLLKHTKNVLLGATVATGLLVAPGAATSTVAADGVDHVCRAELLGTDSYAVISDEFYRERGCRALETSSPGAYLNAYGNPGLSSSNTVGYSYYSNCDNKPGRATTAEVCENARVITEEDWDLGYFGECISPRWNVSGTLDEANGAVRAACRIENPASL